MKTLLGTLAGLMLFALPVQAQKDKKPEKKSAEIGDAEKELKPGKIAGKVLQAADTALQLRVEYQQLELKDKTGKANPGASRQQQQQLRDAQQIEQAQLRAARARNYAEWVRAQQDIRNKLIQLQQRAASQQAGGQNSPYKVVTHHKDFNLDLSGKVVFRVNSPEFLGTGFDDMGNVKKHSEAELKELKGKEGFPGYKAAVTDVKAGDKVVVTLAKDKEAENKLRGTLVLVTEQSKESPKEEKKPRKKNK